MQYPTLTTLRIREVASNENENGKTISYTNTHTHIFKVRISCEWERERVRRFTAIVLLYENIKTRKKGGVCLLCLLLFSSALQIDRIVNVRQRIICYAKRWKKYQQQKQQQQHQQQQLQQARLIIISPVSRLLLFLVCWWRDGHTKIEQCNWQRQMVCIHSVNILDVNRT